MLVDIRVYRFTTIPAVELAVTLLVSFSFFFQTTIHNTKIIITNLIHHFTKPLSFMPTVRNIAQRQRNNYVTEHFTLKMVYFSN